MEEAHDGRTGGAIGPQQPPYHGKPVLTSDSLSVCPQASPNHPARPLGTMVPFAVGRVPANAAPSWGAMPRVFERRGKVARGHGAQD